MNKNANKCIVFFLLSTSIALFSHGVLAARSASEQTLKTTYHALSCQSLLRLHGERISEIGPLYDLRAAQQVLLSHQSAKSVDPNLGAYAKYKLIGLTSRSTTKQIETAQQRLRMIEDDVTEGDLDAFHYTNQIRGRENILEYISAYNKFIATHHQEIDDHVRKQLPRVRMQTLVEGTIYAALTLLAGSAIHEAYVFGEPTLLALAGAFLGIYPFGYWMRTLSYRKSQDLNVAPFFDFILQSIEKKSSGPVFASYGTNHEYLSSVHDSLIAGMDSNERVDLDNLAFAATTDRANRLLDAITVLIKHHKKSGGLLNWVLNEVKENPKGITKHILVDQVFYIDPSNGEPVLLFVYRAFNEKPKAPKTPQKIENRQDEPWTPDLFPVEAV